MAGKLPTTEEISNIIGISSTDSDEVADMRSHLLDLVASGHAERIFGKGKIMTAAHVEKMNEKQVRFSYNRLEATLLGNNTDMIIESLISGIHRAAGAVVPLKNREELDKRVAENNAVTSQLSFLIGRVNRTSSVCVAGMSWAVTLLNHIDWEKLWEGSDEGVDEVDDGGPNVVYVGVNEARLEGGGGAA